jgi:hypothetical protein
VTIKGADWSSHQSPEPSVAGLSFVIIKATEGTSYISPDMAVQTAHARKHGLLVGFYHFLRPGDMRKQAAYFVEKCLSVEGDTLWADWEDPKVSCADKDAFIREVKRLRPTHKVGLYANRDYWVHRDDTSYCGDALWIAQYNGSAGHPNIQHAWMIDQYTSTPIDGDVANFPSKAAMEKWQREFIPKPAAPKPTKPKAPTKPVVSLSHFLAAQKADSRGKQGHTTHKAEALIVEKALRAEGLLSAKWVDGSAGTRTTVAYAAWQHRLGYRGKDADGYAGMKSLTALGKKHGFTVKP